MTDITPKGNVYQRLHAVMGEVGYIQKDKQIGEGKYAYKAVTHDNVVARTSQPFKDHRIHVSVSLVPGTGRSIEVVRPKASGGEAHLVRYEGEFEVTFTNIDDPNDRLVERLPAHGEDSGDKAPGKAISYAKKYGVLQALYIETGENDESRVTEEGPAGPKRLPVEALDQYLVELGAAKTAAALQTISKAARKQIADLNDGEFSGHPDWVTVHDVATKRNGALAEKKG